MSGTELCALCRVNILDGKESYKESSLFSKERGEMPEGMENQP